MNEYACPDPTPVPAAIKIKKNNGSAVRQSIQQYTTAVSMGTSESAVMSTCAFKLPALCGSGLFDALINAVKQGCIFLSRLRFTPKFFPVRMSFVENMSPPDARGKIASKYSRSTSLTASGKSLIL